MADRNGPRKTERDKLVKYRVVWWNEAWEEVQTVENASAGEVMAYVVNFTNAKRKAVNQPDLFVPGIEKLAASISMEVM
jgi:hypothetical protein